MMTLKDIFTSRSLCVKQTSKLRNHTRPKQSILKQCKCVALVVVTVLSVGACSIIPESINAIDESRLVPFASINSQENPVLSEETGGLARWGGQIVAIENLKDHSEIEILHLPTNHYGKPVNHKNSEGRFKAKVKGFVDPLVFEEGRLITVLGEIKAPQEGVIGEQTYLYPTVAAEGYYMWKETQELEVERFYFSSFNLRWGSPFFSNYRWGHRGYRGYHNDRVRVKVKDSRSNNTATRNTGVTSKRSTAKSRSINPSSSASAIRAIREVDLHKEH